MPIANKRVAKLLTRAQWSGSRQPCATFTWTASIGLAKIPIVKSLIAFLQRCSFLQRRRKFTSRELLIADAILRVYDDASPSWHAWRVGIQQVDKPASIAGSIESIKLGQVDKNSWSFDVMNDAWVAYYAREELEEDAQRPPRALVAKLIDPFELFDPGDLIDCWPLDCRLEVPNDADRLAVNLAEMGLVSGG